MACKCQKPRKPLTRSQLEKRRARSAQVAACLGQGVAAVPAARSSARSAPQLLPVQQQSSAQRPRLQLQGLLKAASSLFGKPSSYTDYTVGEAINPLTYFGG